LSIVTSVIAPTLAGYAARVRRNEKGHVPVRYWVLWCSILAVADFVFYVILTPIWITLRVVAWTAEFRARRRR
jgi:hypothetical protein